MRQSIYQIERFDWDSGNRSKNLLKHKVTDKEAEEVFLNEPLLVYPDPKHSQSEKRWQSLGKTNVGRLLFTSFTFRKLALRVISSRDMNKKEKIIYHIYEKKIK